MSETGPANAIESATFDPLIVFNALLRRRWRIAIAAILGGVIGVGSLLLGEKEYVGSVVFVPVATESPSSSFARVAGQFGVSVPTSQNAWSASFFVELLKSPTLLRTLAAETLTVAEMDGARVPVVDLFEWAPDSRPEVRFEVGARMLQANIITVAESRSTGSVRLSATTRWPSVSYALVVNAMERISQFNLQVRQSQASEERRFLSHRLDSARAELRMAEDELERFLRTNRSIASSPELQIQRERIQRDVLARQGVLTSLLQSFEDARIREVRDTPVITIVEPPVVPVLPKPKRLVFALALGVLVGLLLSSLVGLLQEALHQRRQAGDRAVAEFDAHLRAVKELIRRLRRNRVAGAGVDGR